MLINLNSNFHFKSTLRCNSIVQFMIQQKTVNLVFLASNAYRRVINSFYLSYDKPCGKLAIGENCIKIVSDNSSSVAMFLRIETEYWLSNPYKWEAEQLAIYKCNQGDELGSTKKQLQLNGQRGIRACNPQKPSTLTLLSSRINKTQLQGGH